MARKWLFGLGIGLLAVSLWGCGSNGGSGGSSVTPTDSTSTAGTVGTESCVICHTAVVAQGWTGSIHDTAAAGCEGCHGGGQFHRGQGPIPYPSPTLADQCSTCHTDAAMLTRHAGDLTATATLIEGYVLRSDEPVGCRDCHGNLPHGSPVAIEINQAWANSGHAGKIASATPDTGTVWGHYDWDASSRTSCQRCHTATGAMNFLNAPATYSAASNNFSHLEGWTATTSSQQNELLYCWGCHSDVSLATAADPKLRNPGAITEAYAPATTGAPAATVAYPDAANSNVCMGCHLGREVGGNIVNDTDADGVRSFINSHYLAAGGMVFGEAGYEYAGQDYTGWDSPAKHGRHGDVTRFGAEGPCVTCHMTSAEPHKFEVVQKDAAGIITAIATTACDSCHGNMNAAWLEERKETFHVALEALKQALLAKGIEFKPAYPYFYVSGTTTAYTNWAAPYGVGAWKDVMGAAFNYNLLEHDPGAYAHNRYYALKLIADSIDFLADGVVDGAGLMLVGGVSTDLLTPVAQTLGYTIEGKHHDGEVFVKAQYTVDTSVYNVSCGDCHATNPDPTASRFVTNGVIIDQFAESAHGDVFGEAWVHYDWRINSRASCQRCHTATGFVTKLGNEADTTNIFVAGDANLPGEVVRCTACHTDIATGAVRSAAAFTATYSNGATQAFPNVGASNLCVRCHGARESGGSIVNDADVDGVRGFINSHYLAAGATVFAGGGYEFAGPSYANPVYFKHDVVGVADPLAPAATDAGPCAGCHMGTSANHTWEVVAKDATGVITAINSETCASCHAGTYELTPAKLELEKEELHASLAALEAALVAKGIYFYPAHPYFYTAPYVVGGTNTGFTNWAGVYGLANWKDTMGAAFNYNLLEHDPGAYAHNRFYTKRLIFDSIDFLDNGVLDGTISVTGEAATYLGTTRP